MKRYDLSELVKRWELEEINAEQAIGQILLWLVVLAERIAKLEAAQRGRKQQPKSS
jgi:hypothetical protein